ncbi:MAG: hypothetical protein P4L50_01755 [Anaerolineaceae bacterium]|nr:hypothetical protein [Alphaproteobacteria bacterium]MDR3572562.1 hypothetical protein [Anaerolineaceae bacterium]
MPEDKELSKLMTHKGFPLRVLRTVAVALLAIFLLKIVDVFFPDLGGIHGPLYLWLYPVYLLFLIYSLIRAKSVGIIANALILTVLIFVTVSKVYFKTTPLVEMARLHLFSARYQKCAAAAIPIDDKTALGLCDTHDRVMFFDGIAYDSSDEISLPAGSRSAAWKNAARNQKHDASFKQFRFTATRIGDHFYYVNFEMGSRPDF